MHLKRKQAPKDWPVKRKETTFIVKPLGGTKKAIPLLVLLRDMLKIAQNRKEVKKALQSNFILVNGRIAKEEKSILTLFDTLSIIPMNKHYRLELTLRGNFILEEISNKESLNKISKILDKRILKGKKVQLNLSDGKNFLSNIKCGVNDSVIINFIDKKIEECIPLKEKSKVMVFSGKHSGKRGEIKRISEDKKIAEINIEDKKVNVLIKQLMAIK